MSRRSSCRKCGKPGKALCDGCQASTGYANPEYLLNRQQMLEIARPHVRYGLGVLCCICGHLITSMDQVSIEHVIPLRNGGTHQMANLGYAHKRCNSGMHAVPETLRYTRPA